MRSVYQWMTKKGKTPSALRPVLFSICLLTAIAGLAQDTTAISYPWSVIEMTDYRMKPGVVWIKVPPPKGGMPIWIPISGGIVVTGGVVYLLTRDNDSSPDPNPTPLIVADDQLTTVCGQTVNFNPLLNDQGQGLRIIAVSSSAAVSIDWQASGAISVSDLPNSGSIDLNIVVADESGQTAQETATLTITTSPISASDDTFTTDFETSVSGNVLINDIGQQIVTTGFTGPSEGELSLAPDGTFTYVPEAGFSGTLNYTYSIQDICDQVAAATLSITVLAPDCAFTVEITTTSANCGINNGAAAASVDPPGDYTYVWSEGSTLSSINELAAGAISVTVTDQSGQCSASATSTINGEAPAYIDSSSAVAGNCLGQGADILLTTSTPATGPMAVTINGGPSFNIPLGEVSLSAFTELVPGAYNLGVYDSSIGESCTQMLTINIPDNSPLPIAADDSFSTTAATPISDNVLNNDEGLNITLSAIDNMQGGTVTFSSNGAFTFEPFPDFVGEGGFTYMLTDACGETASAMVIINVQPSDCTFSVSISTTPADCGLSNGTATATVSEPGQYSYSWSEGSSSPTIENLAPGSIGLTVTDLPDGLCSFTANALVTELPADVIGSVQPVGGNCLGEGADCIIDFTVAGTAPVIVTLNDGGPFQVPPAVVSLSDYANLLPGMHSLTAYSQLNGPDCSMTITFFIPDTSPELAATDDTYTTPFETALSGNVLDNDDGLNVMLSAIDNVQGGTVIFNSDGSFTFDPFPDFTGEGSFVYTLTDACGETTTATVIINIQAPECTFMLTILTVPADCGLSNGSAEVIIDEPGQYTYHWSTGSTESSVQFIPSGQIDIIVNSQNGLCQAFASDQVGSLPPAYVQNITTTDGNCTGEGADIIIETTSPTGGPLNADLGNGQLTQIPIGLVSLADYVPITPGSYELTIYDPVAGDSCAQFFPIEIMDNTPPLVGQPDFFTTPFQTPFSGNVLENDDGLHISLLDVININGGLVTFSDNGNFTFTPADGFFGEGGFSYTLIDECGNSADTTVVIDVAPPECTYSVVVETDPTDCGLANGTATAIVNEPGEYSYNWSNGSTANPLTNLTAGNYTVMVTSFGGACSQEATGQVMSLEPEYIESLQAIPGNCTGEGADIILTTSTSSGSDPLTVILNGETATDIPVGEVALSDWFELSLGEFTLTVFYSHLGEACSESTSGNIPDNTPNPQATPDEYTTPFGTTLSDNVLDNDIGLDLNLTAVNNVTGGTVAFGANGDFTFEPLPNFSGTGGFSYTAVDACGQAVTAGVIVIVEASECNFSIIVDSSAAHCGLADGSAMAQIDEPGTYTFVWSDGQSGPTATGLTAGNYDVTATETATSCTSTVEFTIAEIPGQYISDLTVIEPTCGEPGDIHFTVSTTISPTLSIMISNSNEAIIFSTAPGSVILSDHMPVVADHYIITVEDPEQGPACAETVSVIVSEGSPGPAIELLESMPPSGPTASDGSLTILITSFTTPPYSILLNGVLSGSTSGEVFTIGDLSAGEYTVQIVDALGCSSNVLEVVLSFTQPLVYRETQWSVPAILHKVNPSNGVEHPDRLPIVLGNGMSTQLTYEQGRNRYQLALWSTAALGTAGQAIQANFQKGWQGTHWAFFNGAAAGYLRASSLDRGAVHQGAYFYWATDVAWQPQLHSPWSLDFHSAFGRQNGWWWSGNLRLSVRW